jgi:uncharacterized membrane protein
LELWNYVVECLQVLARCTHIVTGIAWIGASFYFVWLDDHLEKPAAEDLKAKGVDGELWAVHGGGFYNPQKYMVAPKNLPDRLHWFYWESYSTWLSGVVLLLLTYIYQAKGMLYDPQIYSNVSPTAMGFSVFAILATSWFGYDAICRFFAHREKLVTILTVSLIVAVAVFNHLLYTGRGAYLVTGACLATIMTANVFFVIIPGQRQVIQSMKRGESVDPIYGQRGKQRSVHNTYFTLPVIFAMLSNHFGQLTGSDHRLLILFMMMGAGAVVRRYFVLRHKGVASPWYWILAILLVTLSFVLASPASLTRGANVDGSAPQRIADDVALSIVRERCMPCHSAQPTLVSLPPKGLVFSDLSSIQLKRSQIYEQVGVTKIMPLGNLTHMSDLEREQLSEWAKP